MAEKFIQSLALQFHTSIEAKKESVQKISVLLIQSLRKVSQDTVTESLSYDIYPRKKLQEWRSMRYQSSIRRKPRYQANYMQSCSSFLLVQLLDQGQPHPQHSSAFICHGVSHVIYPLSSYKQNSQKDINFHEDAIKQK